MELQQKIDSYKIGLSRLNELAPRLDTMQVDIEGFENSLLYNNQILMAEAGKGDKKNMQVIRTHWNNYPNIFHSLSRKIKEHTKFFAQSFEIISDKFCELYLYDFAYMNRDETINFFHSDLEGMLTQYHKKAISDLIYGIKKTLIALADLKSEKYCPKEVVVAISSLQTDLLKLIQYAQFWESMYLRFAILIYVNAIKHDIDRNKQFTTTWTTLNSNSDKMLPSRKINEINYPEDSVLWKYMPLSQFIALLFSSTLFIASVKLLREKSNDAREGKYSDFLYDASHGFWGKLPNVANAMIRTTPILHDSTFISSWYEGVNESKQMWKVFTKNEPYGIAIKTTFNKLSSIFNDSGTCFVPLRISYDSQPTTGIESADTHSPYRYKDAKFKYESEIRFVAVDVLELTRASHGIKIEVPLGDLLSEIYLSPGTPDFLVDTYKLIFDKIGISPKITFSELI